MTRRRSRGDSTVEVVVEPDEGGTPASPPVRRIKHPWRRTTALVVVVALALVAVQWQRLARDVDVVDAGVGWTDAPVLMCSGGSEAAVHDASPDRTGDDDRAHLADDPHDVVTLANRGRWPVTLRLTDTRRGAFEADSVGRTPTPTRATSDEPNDLPTPTATQVTDEVRVPAGSSVRLRLVYPVLTVRGEGTGTARLRSIGLHVTSLGVTTTQILTLDRSIYTWTSAEGTAGNVSPLTLADDICAPSR
ncbi:hypothetical protein [Luteimicrobium sp. DT211]|uniref:hypothetical protein n=1 Tax=Luteimicrobium sp. DT211 TaxID=3393412 RepID=UPI003CEC9CFB